MSPPRKTLPRTLSASFVVTIGAGSGACVIETISNPAPPEHTDTTGGSGSIVTGTGTETGDTGDTGTSGSEDAAGDSTGATSEPGTTTPDTSGTTEADTEAGSSAGSSDTTAGSSGG